MSVEGISSGSPPRWSLALIGARVVMGTALLVAPERVLSDLPHREVAGAARIFARVLGVRHLVEAGLLLRGRSRRWTTLGAAVDATHALTMLGLASLRPDRRRLALTNALTAGALAAAGLVEARAVR